MASIAALAIGAAAATGTYALLDGTDVDLQPTRVIVADAHTQPGDRVAAKHEPATAAANGSFVSNPRPSEATRPPPRSGDRQLEHRFVVVRQGRGRYGCGDRQRTMVRPRPIQAPNAPRHRCHEIPRGAYPEAAHARLGGAAAHPATEEPRHGAPKFGDFHVSAPRIGAYGRSVPSTQGGQMRKPLSVIAIAALAAVAGAPAASAHFVQVTPPGTGETVVSNHVGQLPPEHNSCYGLSTANLAERSAAVDFLGPPPSACPR